MVDQIAFIVADLTRYAESELIDLAVEINANLREPPPEGTPRDIGWAYANWTLSTGEPYLPRRDGEAKPTAAAVAAQNARAQQGLNDVLNYKLADGPIFSANNVPYIVKLNTTTHSKQSPPGFVQAAIAKAIVRAEQGQPVLGND